MQGESPRKFDEPSQAAYVALAEQGFTRGECARRCHVSPQTVRQLIKIGLDEHGQPLPGTFAEALREVELECIEEAESQLFKAVQKGEPWAVQMWLKAKDKDTWADKPGAAVNVNVGNNIVVEGSPEERRRTIAALAGELDARAKAITVTSTALPDLDAEPGDTPVD